MTKLEVPRGKFRAALAAVLPHAGRATDDTPHLGRVRFHVTGDALYAYCTDLGMQALAAIWNPDFLDDSAEGFDLAAGEVKKLLQVFRAPSNEVARSMWEKQPMKVDTAAKSITVTETGDIIAGQSLTLPLIEAQDGDDPYPDVPRLLLAGIEPTLPQLADGGGVRGVGPLVVDLPTMSKFSAAAKAYNADWPLVRLVQVGGPADVVLIEIGDEFIGMIRDNKMTEDFDVLSHVHSSWHNALVPMQRPKKVPVPTKVVEGFKALAEDGVTLMRITPDGVERVELDSVDDVDEEPEP